MGSRKAQAARLPKPVADLVATAVGDGHRHDPVGPRTGGPAGNARVTAWVGLVLLVLFLAEAVTLLSLGRLMSVHILVGTVLVPLTLLKTATTGWRILRYYAGDAAYRRAGPPPMLLRLLGPPVILTSLLVLGTGLSLVALGGASRNTLLTVAGRRIDAVTLHQASFIVWLVVVGLHVLVRTVPAVQLTGGTGPARSRSLPGGGMRIALVLTVLISGIAAALVVRHHSGSWTHGDLQRDRHHRRDTTEGSAAVHRVAIHPKVDPRLAAYA